MNFTPKGVSRATILRYMVEEGRVLMAEGKPIDELPRRVWMRIAREELERRRRERGEG